jgi:hypothetical protein
MNEAAWEIHVKLHEKTSNIFIPAGSWSVRKHQIGTKMTIQNVDPDKQVTAVN